MRARNEGEQNTSSRFGNSVGEKAGIDAFVVGSFLDGSDQRLERAVIHHHWRGYQVVHLYQFAHDRIEEADEAQHELAGYPKPAPSACRRIPCDHLYWVAQDHLRNRA